MPASWTRGTRSSWPIGGRRPRGRYTPWPAYDLALREGADGVEARDVRLTRDGHLVCVHDRKLDRTSSGAGLVSAMTLAELRELDFGAWHGSWRADGTHGDTGLLTLDALVELVLDWKRLVKIFIETKHPVRYGALVESKVLALLHRFGIASPASGRPVPGGGDVVLRGRAVAGPPGGAPAADGAARQKPPLPQQQRGQHRRRHRGRAVDRRRCANTPSSSTAPRLRAGRCTAGPVDDYDDVGFCRDVGRGLAGHQLPRPRQSVAGRRPDRRRPPLESAARSGRGVGLVRASESISRATKYSRSNRFEPARSASGEQGRHPCHLLDLLLQEPLHELLAQIVALFPGGAGQLDDLIGDRLLLLQCQLDRARACAGIADLAGSIPDRSTLMSRSRKYCTIIIA